MTHDLLHIHFTNGERTAITVAAEVLPNHSETVAGCSVRVVPKINWPRVAGFAAVFRIE